MIIFPGSKINIGLNVINIRADGYHNIESVFYPISFSDIVEINQNGNGGIIYTGVEIQSNHELVETMYQWLRNKAWIPKLNIHLHKIITIGSGLGGGSADLAAFVKYCQQFHEVRNNWDQVVSEMTNLSKDATFFLMGKPAVVTGDGTEVKEIELNLNEYRILIVLPDIYCKTQSAFDQLIIEEDEDRIGAESRPVEEWKDHVANVFELNYSIENPQFFSQKEMLYDKGATYVSLTGTGSAFYAIFKKDKVEIDLPTDLPRNRWLDPT